MVIRLGWAAARVRAAAWSADRSSALASGRKTSPASVSRAALRGAVQQPGAQLLFEVADLPAQRRLRDAKGLGGPAEVPVLGDDGEVPHQPQVQIQGRRWL